MPKTKTIKIKEIKDPNTRVEVHGLSRIDEIKAKIAEINAQQELCEVPVMEMWDSQPEAD